jgi:serine/threonine protein kinase
MFSMTFTDPSSTVSPSDALLVGNRVEMLSSRPQPDLDSGTNRAYAAQFKGGDGMSDLFAVVCDKNLPARLDSITAMRGIDHPGILRMIDSGVVLWPHDGLRRYVFAYQRPVAARMKQSVDEPHELMSDDFLIHYFIKPMISSLVELSRAGIVHNAIRPTNIFWRPGSTAMPQLGECMSSPAGYGQPVLFETPERAMCAPMGRGNGQHVDDSYALGVILAMLILGGNPMQGMDDETIIRTKIERGSFGALIGNRRISPANIEILRGLLADDARQRWTAADLEQWTNGRRLTPKNTDAGRRAARAFEFMRHEYWQARPLAMAMAQHVSEGAQIVENGSLDKWLHRALNDEVRAASLADAQSSLKQTGKTANFEDQVVARACIALDAAAPIRYRGLSVMPAGIASMLVDALSTGNNIQILAEIISSQLVSLWVEMQRDGKTELVPLGQQIERMKVLLEKTTFGNGIERVAYELNPGLHCLSAILKTQYVTNAKALLPALERVAASGDRPQEPMDRHIAAFLIVRDRRSESLFDAMTSPPTSPKRGLALLNLYSDIQYRHGPDSLPYLAQWLLPLLEPAMQRFLGKTIKERVREQVREAVAHGNLGVLVKLLDDPKRIERDQQEFMAARMLYLTTMKEIAMLENRLANREAVVQASGKPMAASISTFIAILLMFAAILRAAWRMIS